MKKISIQLTTAQFAKLHKVNKRTLHYYDSIGLFSPIEKGENGYRYYDSSQSIDFEYIRMLKGLNMSIEEVKKYVKNPNAEDFIKIAELKEREIDAMIQSLKQTKEILHKERERMDLCKTTEGQPIRIVNHEEEKILILPYDFLENDLVDLFSYMKDRWSIEQIRMGIGAFISIDKVMKNDFEAYDGVYTPAITSSHVKSIMLAKGKYLCGYQKGTWNKLPAMYREMISYAQRKGLKLTGYAYEIGLNEFAISKKEDYITQIMIKIDENY